MSEIEGALLAGVVAQFPIPLGILFYARYSIRGWNSRAVAIHMEHDVRVVGRRILRRSAFVPTGFNARGRVSI